MPDLKDLFQVSDWKIEKHSPVIEGPEKISKGQLSALEVSVGKQIPHPNTTEHHIAWFELYFLADGEKFPYQLARFDFSAHGASVQGANSSAIFTEPKAVFNFKTEKSGKIIAVSYCNIHGLWQGEKEIKVG